MLEAFELSQREQVRNWPGLLRRLAVLRSLDWLRKRYRNRVDARPVDEIALAADSDTAGNGTNANELAERLRRALVELPENQAEAFSLRWFDEFSNEEIAERMGVTPNHVGVLLHRARQALRKLLNDERDD